MPPVNHGRKFLLAAFLALLAGSAAAASPGAVVIHWKDLRPANQPAGDTTSRPQIAALLPDHGETLSGNLAGRRLTIAGYALPVDREGEMVYQFLLVPWTGACSHMPTPPPNQIVLVTPAHPYHLARAYESVSVTGVLKPGMEKSQLFILDGVSVVQSGYAVHRADVVSVESVPDAVQPPQAANPWKFLKK
jgi:hypothetical protein